MEQSLESDDEHCVWNIYNDAARVIMGVGLFITGIFSITLNGWLLLTLSKLRLLENRSHLMVLMLCIVSLLRNLLAGFPFTGTSAVAQKWIFGDISCTVHAFMSQFIGVFQIETLTHMCIERYVVAKYCKYGWAMTSRNYVIMIGLCWFFSIIYTVPTLAGIGRYSCDLSGTACSLDLVWKQDGWTMWYIIAFVLLGGIKPVGVMFYMLWHARQIENTHYTTEEHRDQLDLTQSVIYLALGTLLFWLPETILISWLVLSQLMFGVVSNPPLLLVFFASLASEMATAIPIIVYLWTNATIQTAMLSFWNNHDEPQKKKK